MLLVTWARALGGLEGRLQPAEDGDEGKEVILELLFLEASFGLH